MISHKEVLANFRYDSRAGILYWRRSGKGRKPSLLAGYSCRGYLTVRFEKRSYMGHRLMWFMKTEQWPEYDIDHKDGDPSNNRWSNLRKATRTQNSHNSRLRSNNTSGFKGVFWHRECKGWASTIMVKRKRKWLGAHKTPYLAHLAYRKAARKYFGEYARF